MRRKMTVVFHDEELYRSLKVEAAKRDMAASAIISKAVKSWLTANGDGDGKKTINGEESK